MEQSTAVSMPVYELFETANWETANKYIKLGWVMLKAYTTCYATIGPLAAHQTINYSLAWTDSSKPPEHPKSPYSEPDLELSSL